MRDVSGVAGVTKCRKWRGFAGIYVRRGSSRRPHRPADGPAELAAGGPTTGGAVAAGAVELVVAPGRRLDREVRVTPPPSSVDPHPPVPADAVFGVVRDGHLAPPPRVAHDGRRADRIGAEDFPPPPRRQRVGAAQIV